MFGKILVLILLLTVMFLIDGPTLKHNKHIRVIYGMMMVPLLYLSLMFVLDFHWPNLHTLLHLIFSKPGEQIVTWFESGLILLLARRSDIK